VGATASDDPIAALCAAARRDLVWKASSFALALALHGAGALAIPRVAAVRRADGDRVTHFVDIDFPKTANPPPLRPIPAPAPKPPELAQRPARPPRAATPSPAQAAAVLTKKEEPGEPVDFTNTFVSGLAASYAGGFTVAGDRPAVSPAASAAQTHASRRAGDVAASAGPDRSRQAHLGGGSRWHCPFPPEADEAQVDSAVVRLRVDLDASGKAKHATVLTDPGFGFGREAARCALSSEWTVALDHSGAPTCAIAVVDVRFER
jgi:protein TonB